MKLKYLGMAFIAAMLYSCDDQTSGIGQFIPDQDNIPAFIQNYDVKTKSVLQDAVYARSSTAYLGKYTDPRFGELSADFLSQINCTSNFEFPKTTQRVISTELTFAYGTSFGDSLAPMRMAIYPLTKAIYDYGENKDLYYTDFDLNKYYDSSQEPLAEKVYTAYDPSVSDSLRTATNYKPSVTVKLKNEFGTAIWEKFKENPAYFKDAKSFIDNVLKGFYVQTKHGDGSILYIDEIKLKFTVEYLAKRASTGEVDSIVKGSATLAASKEVFISTRIKNSSLADVVEKANQSEKSSFIKTPAGIYTEVELPLKQMYDDHETDTLNSISISFTRFNDTSSSPYKFSIPTYLLMIRKSELPTFFEENETYDNKTSFLATYEQTTNTYSFTKMNRLVSHIFSEIRAEKEKGEEAWNAWANKEENKDWNKVVLIPVKGIKDSNGSIIAVENSLEMSSSELKRGTDNRPINMQLIYSRPKVESN